MTNQKEASTENEMTAQKWAAMTDAEKKTFTQNILNMTTHGSPMNIAELMAFVRGMTAEAKTHAKRKPFNLISALFSAGGYALAIAFFSASAAVMVLALIWLSHAVGF